MSPARAVGGEALDPERGIVSILRHARNAAAGDLGGHVDHLHGVVDQRGFQQRPVSGRVTADPAGIAPEPFDPHRVAVGRVVAQRLAPRLKREALQRFRHVRVLARSHIFVVLEVDRDGGLRHREAGAVKAAVLHAVAAELHLCVIQDSFVEPAFHLGAPGLGNLAVGEIAGNALELLEGGDQQSVEHLLLQLPLVELLPAVVVLLEFVFQLAQIGEGTVVVEQFSKFRAGPGFSGIKVLGAPLVAQLPERIGFIRGGSGQRDQQRRQYGNPLFHDHSPQSVGGGTYPFAPPSCFHLT